MSEDLVISGSSSMAVATDELYSSAQSLRRLAGEAASLRALLASTDMLVSLDWLAAAGSPVGAAKAELDIDQARIVLAEVEAQARALEWALGAAADGYGFVERFIGGLGTGVAGTAGNLLGRLLPIALLAAPVQSAVLGAITAGIVAAGGPQAAGGRVARWGRDNNELLSNPLTVDLIRSASMSVDDAIGGAAGIPPAVSALVGDGGLGLTGLAFASTVLMGAGSVAGLFTETPVRLATAQSLPVASSPAGYADRLARVPDPSKLDGAQVVIETYSTPGAPDRFEVYIAGTVTFSPQATTEPWDLTSNLSTVAGVPGAAYASVAAAMARAGVDASSPVQFTGYSQGGAVAARLAASGDYNTQGLASFGGPTGQTVIPDGFPVVLVEHSDDLVPALGGSQLNQHAVIVERAVFAGREIPPDYAVPAHHYEYYAQTAALMDRASSEQLTRAASRLDSFAAGAASVSSTAYRFERAESVGATASNR